MTWLSVLWINRGMFIDELQVIVDGTVVQDKYFYNAAYTTWKDSYSSSVFNAILYTNQNLPFTSDSSFWNNLKATYNLTDSDFAFLQNNRLAFMDNLTFNIVYSGVPGLNMSVINPKYNTDVINLNFPGNVINRVSQVVYGGSPCEGVKSFAIATTDVNNDILQYWSGQYPNYQTGAINVAYNTFLTALMVEYYHDQIADNITTPLNITWSRTSPVIVSVGEDAYQTYMTLESDHSMGMTVVGTPENMRIFNFITSYYISPIEYMIMSSASNNLTYQSYSANGGYFGSVMLDLYKKYLFNSTSVETFVQNGFIIEKAVLNDDNFIVIDLETGIVRDINTINNYCGSFLIYFFNYQMITSGFYRPSDPVGEVVTLDAYFWWDGLGRVSISNPDLSIAVDDELGIIGPNGTIAVYYGTIWNPGPPINITSILKPGGNYLQILIIDLYPSMIGSTSMFVVQIYPEGNRAHDNLSFDDLYNRARDLPNDFNNFNNWFNDYFKEFPPPTPTSGDDIIDLLEGNPLTWYFGYSVDINIWIAKYHPELYTPPPLHPLLIEKYINDEGHFKIF